MNHVIQTSLDQINGELTDLKAYGHHRNSPSEPIKNFTLSRNLSVFRQSLSQLIKVLQWAVDINHHVF